MHSTLISLTGLLALASTVMAGTAYVRNNCQEQVFLTITRANQQSTTQAIAGSGGLYSEPISGEGNSFGITKNDQYYSPDTPKLIWGFSDAVPTLYYTISNVDGDPMAGESFFLSSSQLTCDAVDSYDGATHVCDDSNDFTLTLCQNQQFRAV